MSPAPISPVEKVANVIQPTAHASLQDKVEAMRALSVYLGDHVSQDQANQVLSVVSLPGLYANLDIDDDELTKAVCDVINKVLQPFPYEAIIGQDNKTFLIQGLAHFSPSIRYLCLQQVEKSLASDNSVSSMIHSDIFPLVLTTLAFQDTRTATKAVDIIARVALTEPGRVAFFSVQTVAMLRRFLHVSGVVSFRVYELIVRVAASSDIAFQECELSGLLSHVVSEVKSEDLLLKMNAVDMLSEIAATRSGLTFLQKADLLNDLALVLDEENETDVAVVLTKCAVLKFFGKLGEQPDVSFEPIASQYHLLNRLQRCLDSQHKEVAIAAIASIGLIGSHVNGLRLIYTNPLMNTVLEGCHSSTGDVKTVYLQTLSKMLAVTDDSSNNSPSVAQMTLDMFKRMSGSNTPSLSLLISTAKQPVEETKIAAFAVLQSVASHTWGRQEMAQSREFLGYILDRATEHSRQGQTWKYGIVKTLAEAPDSATTFGEHYSMFVQYVRQGPSFQTNEPMAALESA
ncbi:26S proteasome non-ATPase regulatory subunit 5 [Radiomyces spectabilis]|uniref:26S proteasome non-ATPase regulatory subunit 5 n=1 Tax=Radiomyces spectabilis TaxID=64574 RepID=UPI00221F79D9|nr:26S proteasome non-ATPase regulatory subunit 5 [Radiomyces spectabilis]KAI8370415.1 26S proteasome non-ATPase regulatory subunit 5 [Radiomyces spectabilis]